jgi:GT2 family glycosyltransferase
MKISVIIPVYNNLLLTIRCIASIEKSSYHFKDTEVIIIDDGSDDGTANYFTRFSQDNSWLIYHRNASNLKFARSCNAGADIARGEFLVFLNNDTIVTENWDKFLAQTIQSERNIWMAGAKLLYPNGTIQHAGVYLPELEKMSFSHVYRGFPSYFPPAITEKELQCVTAACMIIRKADFIELGGFDTSYVNGLEDVDLCLRIIEKGKKIMYQPKCEVVHFESRSEGRYANSRQNAELFHSRWIGRMKPDLTEMIRKDLREGIDSGAFMQAGEKIVQSVDTGKPVSVAIPMDTITAGDDLLVVLECNSPETAEVKLSYKTRSGYDDRSLLETVHPLTEGENLILFTFRPAYTDQKPVLIFKGKGPQIGITSLASYRFKNGKTSQKPAVAVLYHSDHEPAQIDDLMHDLAQKEILADFSAEKLAGDFTAATLNSAIKNTEADYFLILDKTVKVKPEFLVHAVEIMELNPSTGFVYSDMLNHDGKEEFLNKMDFNPFTFLSKGRTDMAGLFRKKCRESLAGFDENLHCFVQTDFFIGILASGNWKGYKTRYAAIEKKVENESWLLDYKAERDLVLSKNVKYLIKECGASISREKLVTNELKPININNVKSKDKSFRVKMKGWFIKLFRNHLRTRGRGRSSRILITGVGKSGSTALFHAVLKSLPPQTVTLFEPENSKKTLAADTLPPVLVKSFIPFSENFNFFEKKILLVRDPRDNLISLLLYKPYNVIGRGFPGEKEKAFKLVDTFIDLIKCKENSPLQVSVKELADHLDLLPQKRMNLISSYYATHPDVFILKYEDYIDNNLAKLEEYLQLKITNEVEIPENYMRITRSKKYGNWKNWFTSEDIAYFKPLMSNYLEQFGYSQDWDLASEPRLDPETGSRYIEKIVKEATQLRIRKKLG